MGQERRRAPEPQNPAGTTGRSEGTKNWFQAGHHPAPGYDIVLFTLGKDCCEGRAYDTVADRVCDRAVTGPAAPSTADIGEGQANARQSDCQVVTPWPHVGPSARTYRTTSTTSFEAPPLPHALAARRRT